MWGFAQVRNSGGRALEMSGSLTISDGPGGLRAGPYPATLGTTLATGQTSPVSVVLDKQLPSGPWKVRLSLQSGMIKRTVTTTLTFPGHRRRQWPADPAHLHERAQWPRSSRVCFPCFCRSSCSAGTAAGPGDGPVPPFPCACQRDEGHSPPASGALRLLRRFACCGDRAGGRASAGHARRSRRDERTFPVSLAPPPGRDCPCRRPRSSGHPKSTCSPRSPSSSLARAPLET